MRTCLSLFNLGDRRFFLYYSLQELRLDHLLLLVQMSACHLNCSALKSMAAAWLVSFGGLSSRPYVPFEFLNHFLF